VANILPSPFRVREWSLTVAALTCAVVGFLLSNLEGLDLGGVFFLAVLPGTVLFIAIGGQDRVFFTALFTSTMSVGMVAWAVIDTVFIWHQSLSRHLLLSPFMLLLFYVLIPVVLAWLLTFVISRLERANCPASNHNRVVSSSHHTHTANEDSSNS
jgi:hypothetical protein